LPRVGERLVIPADANDDHAWAPVLARLAHARGAMTELLPRTDAAPGTTFATMLNVCRRLGIPVKASSPDVLAEAGTAGVLLGCGRWRASLPDTGLAAWDVAWPGDGGEGMLHRVGASSPAMSCAEVRALDERAIDVYGLPGIGLMENAGIGATAVAKRMLERRGVRPRSRRYALVIVGGGNNGGDALVVARGLMEMNYRVQLAVAADPKRCTPDTRANWEILATGGLPAPKRSPAEPEDLANALAGVAPGADLIVDGLLGTGAKGEPRGPVREAIRMIRLAEEDGVSVLSLDLPSGLDGDSGRAAEMTVRATATVTFAAVKPGLLQGDGPTHAGELYLADIGIPPQLA
jgi:NAD(P)H-hydrate epimerase